jgi:hypothetical protein
MKLRILVGITLVALFVGCAGNTKPSVSPEAKPAIDTAVAIGRGLARVGIAAELKRAGASDAVVSATLDSLHKAVDDLLAGKSIAEVAKDQASWASFRELAVKQLAPMLVTAAPVFDEATAEQLIGTALDIAEAYIKERIGTPTGEAAGAPTSWLHEALNRNAYLSSGRADPAWTPKSSLCPYFRRNGWFDHPPESDGCWAPAPRVRG